MSTDALLRPAAAVVTGFEPPAVSGPAVLLGGRRLQLLPEHAVWDAAAGTVLVSDLHLGKEAAFRAAAIPVPDQTAGTLSRLSQLLAWTGAGRLVILGDLLHARRGRCEQMIRQVVEWREQHCELSIELVRGNHGAAAGDPPGEWRMSCVSEPFVSDGLQLCHDPERCIGAGLAGHLHPVVRLRGPGRDSLRLPCFLLRREVLILPAFSRFVDGRVLQPGPADRVFAVSEQSVISMK